MIYMKKVMLNIVSFMLTAVSLVYAGNTADLNKIIQNYKDASRKTVLVAAHRGAHRSHPENSISAINAAITLGVDIVEIDVRETKDGQLVLLHDATVDRTTNGSGSVYQFTLEELKKLHLKMPDGTITGETIPTLKEAMLAASGKIIVNLDKSEDILEECIRVLKQTDTESQAILKGNCNPYKVKAILKKYNSNSFFMPLIASYSKSADTKACKQLQENTKILCPQSVELVFKENDTCLLSQPSLEIAKQDDIRLWCNTLVDIGAGDSNEHDDQKALTDPDNSWGWLIKKGISIIQTDEPEILLEYLRTKGLHD